MTVLILHTFANKTARRSLCLLYGYNHDHVEPIKRKKIQD